MPTTSFILERQFPPLTFVVLDGTTGSTVYPFRVQASRALFRNEARAARKLCLETFGPGGRIIEPGHRWFGDEARGCYSFMSEADMTVFVVGMSG